MKTELLMIKSGCIDAFSHPNNDVIGLTRIAVREDTLKIVSCYISPSFALAENRPTVLFPHLNKYIYIITYQLFDLNHVQSYSICVRTIIGICPLLH